MSRRPRLVPPYARSVAAWPRGVPPLVPVLLAVLTLAGVFCYVWAAVETARAQPRTGPDELGNVLPVVAFRLVNDGLLLAAWLASAAGTGLLALRPLVRSPLRHPRGQRCFHVTTAAALGLGPQSLAVLGLGLLGWLTRPVAFALVVAGLACGGVALYLDRRRATEAAPPDPASPPAAAVAVPTDAAGWWAWAWLAVVPSAVLAIVSSLVTPGILWKPDEPHGYDVVEYHLQVPREWYEAGRIVPLEHNVFSHFPFNVETHYLLAMHLAGGPWRGMYLAQFMHATVVALAVAAACGAAGLVAPSRRSVVLAGVATATVPWLALLAPMAYNEGGLLLYGTLAAGWALRGLREPVTRVRDFALAGGTAGLACGCKLTAVPMVLLAVPAVAGAVLVVQRLRRRESSPPASRDALALGGFLVAGTLLFAPWLARTFAWTGNPVFPEATAVFGRAPFGDEQVERWRRAHAPQPAQAGAAARVREFGRQVVANWQFGYVLLPLGVVALGAARRDPAAWFLGGLLLLLLAFWLGFTHLQGRFFVFAVPLCALLVSLAPWDRLIPHVGVAAPLALIVLAAPIGWRHVHQRLSAKLTGGPGEPGGMVEALGRESVDWLRPPALDAIPPGDARTIALAGDAKAFWYTLPMARLRYRTVFDAKTDGGRGVAEAWLGGADEGWVLIDPGELGRFHTYYQPFPAPPLEWTVRPEWGRGQPFLMAGGEAQRRDAGPRQ